MSIFGKLWDAVCGERGEQPCPGVAPPLHQMPTVLKVRHATLIQIWTGGSKAQLPRVVTFVTREGQLYELLGAYKLSRVCAAWRHGKTKERIHFSVDLLVDNLELGEHGVLQGSILEVQEPLG